MNGRQVFTPAQAAGLLGLGKTTVVEWCQRGILPAMRIESRWYLKRAELIRDGWLTAEGGGTDKSEAPVAAGASEISPERHTRKDAIS